MGKSKIEWTDATWNPITGCTKVSEGCKNCYAEGIAKRFWGDRSFNIISIHEDRLEQPLHWRKPRRIFVCSMGDLFHPIISFDFIDRVGEIVTACAAKGLDHTFIILTKRPERMKAYFEDTRIFPNNVWLGVTAENQKCADERIPILLQIPAAVRFVSVEPMLEQIDISYYLNGCPDKVGEDEWAQTEYPLDWVICGCESGPSARPFDESWARDLKDQCVAANVPFFYKQGRQDGKLIKMPELDGRVWDQYPEAKDV